MEGGDFSSEPRGRKWQLIFALTLGFIFVVGASRAFFRPAPLPQPSPISAAGQPSPLGDIWFCPPGKHIAAYGQFYYPRNHPSPPPRNLRPEQCFVNDSDAAAAGFSPATPPPGGELIRGVYLIATSAEVLEQCLAYAKALGHAVPCPRLIGSEPPAYGETISCWSEDHNQCGPGADFYFDSQFMLPFYSWASIDTATISISASPRRDYFDYLFGCQEQEETETSDSEVAGFLATKRTCERSITYFWSNASTHYSLGVFGGYGSVGPDKFAVMTAVAHRLAEMVEMVE